MVANGRSLRESRGITRWPSLPLACLLLLKLMMATVHYGSEGIAWTESTLAILTGLIGLIVVSLCLLPAGRLLFPRVLMPLVLIGLQAVSSVVIAFLSGYDLVWSARRAFVIVDLPVTALATFWVCRNKSMSRFFYMALVVLSLSRVAVSLKDMRLGLLNTTGIDAVRAAGGWYFAPFALVSLSGYWTTIRAQRPLHRLLVIIGTVVGFMGLILTFTRTYWLGVAAGIATAWLVLRRRGTRLSWRYLVLGLMLPVTLLIGTIAISPEGLTRALLDRGASLMSPSKTVSFQERMVELATVTRSAASDIPMLILGHGMGSKYAFNSLIDGWTEREYSHNYFAYILWALGLLGLALFIDFWVGLFRRVLTSSEVAALDLRRDLPVVVGGMGTLGMLLVASLAAPPLLSFIWSSYYGAVIGIVLSELWTKTPVDS